MKSSDFEQIGHGISEDLINKVREITREFFKLPYEEKLKIKMTPSAGYRFVYIINSFPKSNSFKIDVPFKNRGYQRIGENVTKGKPDMHEAIDVSYNYVCVC